MITTLAALAILAAAQDREWQVVRREDGFTASIDPASVSADGPVRRFRIQVIKEGAAEVVEADTVVQCEARTMKLTHGYVYRNGELVGEMDVGPEEGVNGVTGRPAGLDEMVDLVCDDRSARI